METLNLICECYSYEHQAIFWYDDEDKQLYATVHLITHKGFFKRLWIGIKYAFGYNCRFGNWDEFIFKPEDEQKLHDYLLKYK